MRIRRLLTVASQGSYYCEDLTALQTNPVPLAERYTTPSSNPYFKYLREPGEAVSVGVELDDNTIHWGDCVSVAYAGKAGRDGAFRSKEGIREITEVIAPLLANLQVISFRETVDVTEKTDTSVAVRYGISQALLRARAHQRRKSPCSILCEEWNLPLPSTRPALHAQSGSERYSTVDKMIARRIQSLPHGLVDDIPDQLGSRGEKLVEYAGWIRNRLARVSDYTPTIHLDVHGGIGKLLNHDLFGIVSLIEEIEKAVKPYPLRMESVVIAASKEAQIDSLRRLQALLRSQGSHVSLVADEWANTLSDIQEFADAKACDMVQVKMPDLGGLQNSLEAVLYCKERGVQTFLGGTCNETEISSRLSAHVALACQPTIVMAKPGMGVDEAIMLVGNEMDRTLEEIHSR